MISNSISLAGSLSDDFYEAKEDQQDTTIEDM
jgi:hypothetical protein